MAVTKDIVELTARIVSIPISRPSQYNEGKHWVIVNTDQGKLSGEIELGQILLGCDYRFGGFWEENQYGKTFKFRSFTLREPSSRNGVVNYLQRYAPWIGSATANKLCDKFGVDTCIAKLRDDPEAVASTPGLNGMTLDRCREASKALKTLVKFEETRVALLDIFAGRKFRHNLPDLCIEKWGASAAEVVRKNAFVLLEEKFPGCGFLLVDQLYQALGGDPSSMTRQVYALVYVLENLADNSTWGKRANVLTEIGKLCSKGLQFAECIDEAVKANKVAVRNESDGMWLAAKSAADEEVLIATMLHEIADGKLLGELPEFNPLDDLLDDQSPRLDVRETPSTVPAKSSSKGDGDDSFGEMINMDDDGLNLTLDASDDEADDLLEESRELVVELDSMLEQISDIDAAVDYVESVGQKLADISETIEKRGIATACQVKALRAMLSGAERWNENRKD